MAEDVEFFQRYLQNLPYNQWKSTDIGDLVLSLIVRSEQWFLGRISSYDSRWDEFRAAAVLRGGNKAISDISFGPAYDSSGERVYNITKLAREHKLPPEIARELAPLMEKLQ